MLRFQRILSFIPLHWGQSVRNCCFYVEGCNKRKSPPPLPNLFSQNTRRKYLTHLNGRLCIAPGHGQWYLGSSVTYGPAVHL